MRMVFSNENRFIVANAKNILEAHGFTLFINNEHAAGVVGELSAFDAWLELWVVNDADYDRACEVLKRALSDRNASSWQCEHCHEENDASFELCWHCGAASPADSLPNP